MGFLDKINPLKKKDDAFPDFSDSLGKTTASVPGPSFDSASMPQMSSPVTQPEPISRTSESNERMISMIQELSRKVDSLSSTISSLSQRISNLETSKPKPAYNPQQNQNTPNPYTMNNSQNSYNQQNTSNSSYNNQNNTNNQNVNDDGWHF
tara:strand:+ start:77 stop:529 length:453 start_codon:yes stop_codon:yes gene_type:complete